MARYDYHIGYQESKGQVVVNVPGFRLEDFNRAGYPSLAKLLKSQEVFFYSPNTPAIRMMSNMPHNIIAVIKLKEINIPREMYDDVHLDYPFKIIFTPIRLGQTSYDFTLTSQHLENGDIICTTGIRNVCMDKTTKKGADLPQALKDKLFAIGIDDEACDLKTFQPLSIPENHYKQEIKVLHDDLDDNFHTNDTIYVKYVENCAATATKAGFYRVFKDDICFYLVKKATVLYVRESFVGDRLIVYTWQDRELENLLYFEIQKNNTSIFYARLEYHSTERAKCLIPRL